MPTLPALIGNESRIADRFRLFMDAPLSPQLGTSIVIVSASTYLYNLHPPPRPVAAGNTALPLASTPSATPPAPAGPGVTPGGLDAEERLIRSLGKAAGGERESAELEMAEEVHAGREQEGGEDHGVRRSGRLA